MGLGRVAEAVGKGLLAGAAGTAVMTVSSTLEQKARGREASTVPAEAAEEILEIEPRNEQAEQRLNTLSHFAIGTGWGVPRAFLGMVLRAPAATAVHFGAVWASAMGMIPALGLGPPPTKWGAKEVAVDAWHHAVYAVTTGAVFELLNRRD